MLYKYDRQHYNNNADLFLSTSLEVISRVRVAHNHVFPGFFYIEVAVLAKC